MDKPLEPVVLESVTIERR